MRSSRALATAALLLPLLLLGCAERSSPTELAIVPDPADPGRVTVRLTGAGATALRRQLNGETSQARVEPLFYLTLRQAQPAPRPTPLLARLEWAGDAATLTPQASLTPGLTYRAVFEGERVREQGPVSAEYTVPDTQGASEATVSAVYPRQETVPANLLKLYVHFTRPMAQGRVFEHVRLLDADGKPVEQAFREVELWADGHRRLTLWINPGRTKRSLGLSESLGPVLVEGRRYTLEISAGLPDQRGRPLGQPFRHSFRTAGPDREQPRIDAWLVSVGTAGSRAPLTVDFHEPLDHALAARVLHVETADRQPVPGAAEVDPDGRRWRFTPEASWRAGEYQLVAGGELEDLAGNSLYRAFETPAGAPAQPVPEPPVFRRPFTVP